ncbi:PIG-L deacetylase family protein [Streptomyces sp. NPDC004111]|uniref:PIG-L deacetylase family protein n=1 Tax=Streptomyces sp. NPDC004111 TaxID=3364690 RepID=UPI0036CA7E87
MATLVAFFAHPDDEVLHAGGTLARAAAEGHRVVLVTATDGELGPAPETPLRLDELRAAARELRASRVVHLGYADSGHGRELYPDPPDRARFVRAPVEEAAARLAAVLRDEHTDVLVTHDADGAYGHRDHVRAHEVAVRAAELAGVRRVLAAAVVRTAPIRLLRLTALLWRPGVVLRPDERRTALLRVAFTPRARVTHAIDGRRYAARKQAALAAHGSQVWGTGRSAGAFRALVRMPTALFGRLLGREWFVEL